MSAFTAEAFARAERGTSESTNDCSGCVHGLAHHPAPHSSGADSTGLFPACSAHDLADAAHEQREPGDAGVDTQVDRASTSVALELGVSGEGARRGENPAKGDGDGAGPKSPIADFSTKREGDGFGLGAQGDRLHANRARREPSPVARRSKARPP